MKGEIRALTIIALAATLLLAGCGQKGPLYMPTDSQGDNAAMVSEKPSKTANGESTPADTAPDAPDAPEDES